MNGQLRFCIGIAAALSLVQISAHAASLTVDTIEPSGPNVIIANPHSTFSTGNLGPVGERDTFTTMFPAGQGSRGQSFLMPNNPNGTLWDLSSFTLRADANPNGSGFFQDLSTNGAATITMWLFEWNPSNTANDGSQWILGDGASDGDAFDGTGFTTFLINGATFDVTRTFSGEFLHISTPGVQLTENTAYGVLFSLETTEGTGSLRLDWIRDGTTPTGEAYLDGANLRSDAAVNTFNPNGDDMVFYVEATAVPEPGSFAILGISLAMFAARNRRQS